MSLLNNHTPTYILNILHQEKTRRLNGQELYADYFWQTKSGQILNISDMSIEHITNLEKMVEQTIDINDIFDWDYLG